MSTLALSLKLSAVKTLSAVQRAINILRSAGPGAWYDPSDIANYTATGPELVTNGTFDTNTTGWTPVLGGTITHSAGSAVFGSSGVSDRTVEQSITTKVGSTYRINVDVSAISAGAQGIMAGTVSGGTNLLLAPSTALGSRSATFTATTTTTYIGWICGDANRTATIDNISIKELTGLSACTMFQDSAGSVPVTAVEQPVGLILDKSKGLVLGAELVTNRDFSNGNTGWVRSGPSWSGLTGAMVNDGTNVVGAQCQQNSIIATGKTYRIEFDLTRTSGTLNVWLNGSQLVQAGIATSGRKTFTVASTVSGNFMVEASAGAVLSIDNISVRELPGHHAIQPTATSRPTLSSRYNLLTKTEQFDDAAWTKARMTVTANATTAPDGTLTADKLVESVDNGQHYVLPGMVTYSATAYTISIYAKAAERSVLQFVNVTAFPSAYVNFDLSAGTVSAQSGVDSVSITSVGNGWYRCSFVDTATVAGSAYGFGISTQISPTAALGDGYASDGTSGLFVWGAQLETVG